MIPLDTKKRLRQEHGFNFSVVSTSKLDAAPFKTAMHAVPVCLRRTHGAVHTRLSKKMATGKNTMLPSTITSVQSPFLTGLSPCRTAADFVPASSNHVLRHEQMLQLQYVTKHLYYGQTRVQQQLSTSWCPDPQEVQSM